MTIQYTNQSGESLPLRQRRPYFLQRAEDIGNVCQVLTALSQYARNEGCCLYFCGGLRMSWMLSILRISNEVVVRKVLWGTIRNVYWR